MAESKKKPGAQVTINAGIVNAEPGSMVGIDESTGKKVTVQGISRKSPFFDASGSNTWKRLRQFIALGAGLVMIGTVVAIALKVEHMSAPLYTFLRIVLALGAAAFAVCIDGFIEVKFKTWLRATGGLAVFSIVYFCNVAAPTAPTPVTPDVPANSTTQGRR